MMTTICSTDSSAISNVLNQQMVPTAPIGDPNQDGLLTPVDKQLLGDTALMNQPDLNPDVPYQLSDVNQLRLVG